MKKKVGVLALQGDFAAHQAALERAGAEAVPVRDAGQLRQIDGLVIPGGESTTMLKLLHYDHLLEPVVQFAREKPVFGTCAGAILLAKGVSHPSQESFGVMDIDVERNGYGRQLDSRVAELEPEAEFAKRTAPGNLEAVFIRAPIIRRIGAKTKVLVRYNGDPVLVEERQYLAATFHPELTSDSRIHKLFLEKL
ncbi:MAG TPA: pyridoxal 5'-phosphate synthase glutaminase subunit PdxT [Bryobacteraceae bacterium]|nr:pyridoxal 5'-phosphate synthase glutaminase subunit PdxT [Bryobacteraceae bacterium]